MIMNLKKMRTTTQPNNKRLFISRNIKKRKKNSLKEAPHISYG
jgi:hypothetical protein